MGCVFGVLFLSSAFFVKGLWLFVWRCFGGPLACEVEPQAPVWVGCSKPSCFTRFWAGSGCGGLAGGRAWGALGASLGAPVGLWALWVPLGGSLWGRLGASGLSGSLWESLGGPPGPPRGPQRRLWEALGGLWGPLGVFGSFWGPLGAFGGLWGFLGASGSFSAALSRCSQDSPY